MNDTKFSLDKFSTDFLVECILQHLESITFPRYAGNHIGNLCSGSQGDLKKWLRLTETFFQCLKQDVKSLRCNADKSYQQHKEIRHSIASVIAHWFPDLDQLKEIYVHMHADSVSAEKKTNQIAIATASNNSMIQNNEVESWFNQVETLHNMATYIHARECMLQKQEFEEQLEKKSEVVFVYGDNDM